MSLTKDPNKLVGAEFEAHQMGVLSFQQARVLLLSVDRGLTAGEIAKVLDLSEHTIVCHIENGKDKLGAINKVHYTGLAFKLGILRARGFCTQSTLVFLFLVGCSMFVSMTMHTDMRRGGTRLPKPTARVTQLRGGRKD